MSLKMHYDYLMGIKAIPGKIDKIAKLKAYLQDKDAVRIIKLMYDDEYHFGVKKLPPMNKGFFTKGTSEIFEFLKKLALQKGTSNGDKKHLSELASIDKETYELVQMIVRKDAKCGFSYKSINAAIPDTVFITPYCRCKTTEAIKNITYPAIVQEKADGMFVNLSVSKLYAKTRNWKSVQQIDHIFEAVKKLPVKNRMLHGELRVRKNGVILDRQTGNGILNSCLQGTADPEDAKCVFFTMWDCMTETAFFNEQFDVGYINRWGQVQKIVKELKSDCISAIETKEVLNYKEAKAFYDRMRKEGKEGAILKNFAAKWKFHDSPDMIKMKNSSDAEMVIVGWKYGKEGTRLETMMGAVLCESEDGKVKVSISGFSDKMRDQDWDQHIGKVITVEFEGLIKDRKSTSYSLYLPRRKKSDKKIDTLEFRPDRSHGDTLKDIQKRMKKAA